ncbi:MAG: hypothetical protein ACKO9V_07685 [Candidatus Kapaibacterium sp.]
MQRRVFVCSYLIALLFTCLPLYADVGTVRVLTSSVNRLSLVLTPMLSSTDTAYVEGKCMVIPRFRTSSEVLLSDNPSPVVLPAERELISVPGPRHWTIES